MIWFLLNSDPGHPIEMTAQLDGVVWIPYSQVDHFDRNNAGASSAHQSSSRSAWSCLPQEVGKDPLQKAFLQGPGEVAAGLHWCDKTFHQSNYWPNCCVRYSDHFSNKHQFNFKFYPWLHGPLGTWSNFKMLVVCSPGQEALGWGKRKFTQTNLGAVWRSCTWSLWPWS